MLNFVRDNHLLLPEQLVNYQTRAFSPKNLYDLVYDIKDKLVVFSRTPAAFNIYLKTALSSDLDMFVILNDNIKAVKGMQFPGVLHSLTLADTRRCDMLDSILRIEPKLVDSKVQRILKENEDLMVFEKQCEPATLFLYLARYFWRDGAMMNTTTFKRMILDDCHMTNFAIEAMKAWHRCSEEDQFNLCFDLALFGTARELRFLNIDPTTVRDGDRDVLFDVFGR